MTRVVFLGGTGALGGAAVPLLLEAGHEVTVAHRGETEQPAPARARHLHGDRDALLAPDGPLAGLAPGVLVDTFGGGATAAKARMLLAAAKAAGARVVAVSSMDVYRHCVDAGLGDGSGATELPRFRVPLEEDAELRSAPYPGAAPGHDNAAAERVLGGSAGVTVLRPGTIYGPHAPLDPRMLREWFLVGRVHRGERRLELPDGGTQLFHRVALERVARAIAAAVERPAEGFRAVNVVDPTDWTFAGLAERVARVLDWEWELEPVAWPGGDHPWNTRHPVLASDRRLRDELGVGEPDPDAATDACIRWLWEHRRAVAARCA